MLSGGDWEMPSSPALPTVPAASEARTLIEVLEWHAARHPDRLHLTVLQDEATVLGSLTYAELVARAHAVARGLIARDVTPGDGVALMLPPSIEYFIAFFGILYAGAIPVPIYPPMRLSQIEDHLRRQIGILRNAGACLLITMPEGLRLAGLLRAQVESLNAIESVAYLVDVSTATVDLPQPNNSDSVALIQYTSGSTGDPKGVVLSHSNLLANIRAMGGVMDESSADVFVGGLPLSHDMGLIGAWLGCLYFAAPLYVMSPLSFLVRPESWLWAIHRFRATLSAAPNFGFELCLNKIDDANLAGLDLSSLRMVANGAEPVGVQTVRRFIAKFGRFGFRAEAMAPVYGLAEKGGRVASNSAAHRRPPAISATRPRRASCSATDGSTARTVPTSPAATSTSPAGARASSFARAAISTRRRSKKRSPPSRASARAAWPCSGSPIGRPAQSGSSCWRKRASPILRPARRCMPARKRWRARLPGRRPMKSCWRPRAPCRRHRAARTAGGRPRGFTRPAARGRRSARCGGRSRDCRWPRPRPASCAWRGFCARRCTRRGGGWSWRSVSCSGGWGGWVGRGSDG